MSESIFARRMIGDISVVVPSRHGGVSLPPFDSLNLAAYVGDEVAHVSRNFELLGDELGASVFSITAAEHGIQVLRVKDGTINPPCDALVTTTPGLALVALAADCVPIALVDPINRVTAVIHAGWKGVLLGVVDSAVDAFVEAGADMSSTVAVIGPSICGHCYEVQADRVELVRAIVPEAIADDRHLDLTAGIRAQLNKYGCEVDVIAGCTNEDSNLFSYRGAHSKPTGRGGIVVVMPEPHGERPHESGVDALTSLELSS
jgi:YfiH family protein